MDRPMLFISGSAVQVVDGKPAGIRDIYDFKDDSLSRGESVRRAAEYVIYRDRAWAAVMVRKLMDDRIKALYVIS